MIMKTFRKCCFYIAAIIPFFFFIYILTAFSFKAFFTFNIWIGIALFFWLIMSLFILIMWILKNKFMRFPVFSFFFDRIAIIMWSGVTFVFAVVILLSSSIQGQLNQISNGTSKAMNEPYLEITVLDWTKTVNTYCDPVFIKFKAKNTGKKALKYSDLTSKQYRFGLRSGSDLWPVWLNNSIAKDGSEYNSTIEDFGSIKPGETKTLIIYSAANHCFIQHDDIAGDYQVCIHNVFANEAESRHNHKENNYDKNMQFQVSFEKLVDTKHRWNLGESNLFKVYVDIFNGQGSLKDCPMIK